MPVRYRGRTRGLPRNLAPPEANLVQSPELTSGIARFLGLRQAHVAPALSEGLGAQLLTGDIRQDPRTRYPLSFAEFTQLTGDTITQPRQTFINPPDHNRVVQLRRFHAYSAEGAPGPLATYFYYSISVQNIIPTTQIKAGQRTMFGYSQGIGPQLFPPTQPYPEINPRTTKVGWQAVQNGGINASYIWRAPWFGTVIGAASWQFSEILENFDDTQGPRIVLYPGSAIDFGIADANAIAYLNMWWDEYPLT